MSETEERRAPGAGRIPVKTLVEICGSDPSVPAFEAQSLNLSGRGMKVRTAYLPKLGDPLVCRFGEKGREVMVEGEVAWCEPSERGGQFGIRFTALDSGSVEALRELCAPPPVGQSGTAEGLELGQGARVRLHIEGLSAPMKARVREGTHSKLRVGSTLEFLKVGRRIELEDIGRGERADANIDAVSIAVDPQTRIPELVVALRFNGEDATPEPSVIESAPPKPVRAKPETRVPREVPAEPPVVASGSASSDVEALDDADFEQDRHEEIEEDDLLDTQLWQAKLSGLFNQVHRVARVTGRAVASSGGALAKETSKLLSGATRRAARFRQAQAPRSPRRTTAPPPGSGMASGWAKRQKPQAGNRAHATAASRHPGRHGTRMVVALLAITAVASAATFALTRSSGDEQPRAAVSRPQKPAVPGDVTAFDDQGNPIQGPAAAQPSSPTKPAAPPQAKATQRGNGVTANVPLFGPTPMATMEPAPLEPSSEEDEEARERAAAAAAVDDETWQESKQAPKSAQTSDKPQSVKPWGRGRLHLPTIHRIRLDKPGADIQGAIQPNGFTIVVPGRKAMESGKSIARRDQRILAVNTSNTAAGAQVTFKFRGGVPPYRVRLRKDFVEFLVSAPEN